MPTVNPTFFYNPMHVNTQRSGENLECSVWIVEKTQNFNAGLLLGVPVRT